LKLKKAPSYKNYSSWNLLVINIAAAAGEAVSFIIIINLTQKKSVLSDSKDFSSF